MTTKTKKAKTYQTFAAISYHVEDLIAANKVREAIEILDCGYHTLCEKYRYLFQSKNESDLTEIGTEQYNKGRGAWKSRKHRLKKTIQLEPKPQPQLTEPPASILSPDSENILLDIFPTSTSKVSQTKMNPNFIQTPTHGRNANEYDTGGTLPQSYTPVRGNIGYESTPIPINVAPSHFTGTPLMRPAVGNESCSVSASVSTLGSTMTHETVPQKNHFSQIVWKHVVRNDLTIICPDKVNMDIISSVCEGDDEMVYDTGLSIPHLERLTRELQEVGLWRKTANRTLEKLEKAGMLLDDFYDNGTGEEIYREWLNETETAQRELEEKLRLIVATKNNAKENWLKVTQAGGRQKSDTFKKNVKAVNDWLKGKEKDMQVDEGRML